MENQHWDSFTNVFDDEMIEENSSQPLSLPTTCDTLPESLSNGLAISCTKDVRPLKHTGQYGDFRSVEEIDIKYRCLFTYPYFNLVQSRVIDDALYSDKSMVVCAPTGSGKTVVFELAILQLLMQMEDTQSTGDFKIIYMAPVKAVCNERLTEWYPKLTKLGLLCLEVTGDTEVDFAQLKPYKVIITTPEKWDMLTRRWRDHRGLVEMIKLFLIDEVHILNDESRGPVLETVVSRMKTVESAAQSAHRIEQLQKQYQGEASSNGAPPRIRFVAVSATVSNPEDVADWLGTSEKPAVFYKFGDECRPVKLQRIVEGYHCAEGTSIFKFDLILNYKLWPIIQKYYNGKPTLIFCNTRKSVALTAEALSREVTVSFSPEQKAKLAALASTLKTKKLQTLVMSGVGCHHAGLLYEERVNIELAFRNRDLPILITTTTLAMGVNLPAHLVIVKNTLQYVNGAYQEYSISTVLQMVGRAGRPQFDTEATAVIMTRLSDKPRYQALVGGSEPLQSYLHKRIAENLNSEAALGTVTDVAQCVEWLRSTFLYVRAAKDPKRYLGLPPAAPIQLILKKIEELCVKAMNSLASSGLITMDEASCIESTEAGRLMSLFYLDVETMKNIMKIEGTESLERLLWIICESHELSDMHLRMDERRCLNLLNRNNTAATIRFPMKGKISTRQMKLNCIIQATLGCLAIPEPSLNQEAMKVRKTASRVCKCLVKYVSRPQLVSQQPQFFLAVLNSILLSKCIEAHLWENSPYVSKQLKGIGPTFSTLLATAGVTSFMLLEESHPRDLERIMNKGPPAGNMIRKQVSLLPKYQLTVTPIDSQSMSVQLMLLNHAHLSENMNQLTAGDGHKSYLIVGDSENHLLLLTQFTDKDLISVYDGTMKYEIKRKISSEHKILIHCVSSVIVGIDVQADYLFLDLEPHQQRENEFTLCSNSILPRQNVAEKQTTITDVYKQRKRKNNFDNDIAQCKEKIKRENNLTKKLKALKDSFGKTSTALKKDIDKSTETSNKLLHDLLNGKSIPDCPRNGELIKKVPDESPPVDLTKEITVGPSEEIIINDDDDYIDDLQIDSILSKIESEISGNDPIPNNIQKTYIHDSDVYRKSNPVGAKYKNIGNIPYLINESKSSNDSRKRKNFNTRTNFSFIDLMEKKANTNEEENFSHKNTDSGFSDTIKSEINKFLQRTQDKTNLVLPEINELAQTSGDEELPEVHVKNAITSETHTNAEVHEHDYIDSFETDNKGAQCITHESTREYPEQSNLSDANNGSGEDLVIEQQANIALTLKPNIYPENLVQTNSSKVESPTIKCNTMGVCGDLEEISKVEENTTNNDKYECGENGVFMTALHNTNTAVTNDYCHSPGTVNLSSNVNNALEPLIKSYDKNALVNSPGNTIQANEANRNTNLTSYRHHQHDMNMIDKLMIPYEYNHQNLPDNIENYCGPNWVALREMVPAQANVTNLKKMTCNKNYVQSKVPADRFSGNAASVINRNEHCSHAKLLVEQERHKNCSNQQQTHFKRYSYTATKVDVCTKKYAPDHELRITRKLKLDLDITEILKHDGIKTIKVDPGQEHADIKKHQNNKNTDSYGYVHELSYKEVKPNLKNILRCEVTNVKDRCNHTKNTKETLLEGAEAKCPNTSKSSFENDKRTSKNLPKSADIVVIDEYNDAKDNDARTILLGGTEETPKRSITNNSIENILQKYSKILVIPKTNPAIVNKMNKNAGDIGGNKAEPKSSVTKSRKPFRIGEINSMNMPLPETLTNATRSASFNATPTNPIQADTLIKKETTHDLELSVPNETNMTSKTCDSNDRSYESPISVHSLQLDPTEDIKEENMLNPKLLLQYFSEGSVETTDIIAPPAQFCDNAIYSPSTSPELRTELYEDFSDQQYSNQYMENMGDKFDSQFTLHNSSTSLRSPKHEETWCLTRDEKSDTYSSQPVASAPWIISREIHNSQVNANVGSRRAKLCQFRFIRKKPFFKP